MAITESIFGKGSWKKTDYQNNRLVYVNYNGGVVEIMKIENPKDVFNSYADFREFDFLPLEEGNLLLSDGIKAGVLFEKDYFTGRGQINERLGFWNSSNDGIIFHNFNVYCSEDLYLRLSPEWSVKNDYYYSKKYSELSSTNQFSSDREEILPKATALLNRCPLGAVQKCEECAYRFHVEDSINEILGENYIFLQKKSNSYAELENENAKLVEFENISIYSEDLEEYANQAIPDDLNWTRIRTKELEYEISREPEKIIGTKRYNYYSSHNVKRNDFYSFSCFN